MPMRGLAFLLDYIVVMFISVSSGFILALSGNAAIVSTLTEHARLYGYLLLVGYMTTAISIFHTTVGKALCNLKVISTIQGEEFPTVFPILLREAFGRFICSILFGWGYWAALGKPGKQAWSDEIANTRVIKAAALSRRAKILWAAVLTSFLVIECWAWSLSTDTPSSATSGAPAIESPIGSGKPTGQAGYSEKLPAVLTIIMSKGGKDVSQGSGFLINQGGEAVTNVHVLRRGDKGRVELGDGRSFQVGEVSAVDIDNDLVIFRLKGDPATAAADNGFPFLSLGDSGKLNLGDRVVSISSPEGLGNSISEGILSARRGGADSFLQITAPISHGSSGGPLLDSRGEVVGVTVAQMKEGQNLNFAIPVERVKQLQSKPLINPQALPEFFAILNGWSPQQQTTWTGTYQGSVYNKTAEQGAQVALEIEQTGGDIHGCFVVTKPLYGSGSLEGTADEGELSFSVSSEIGTLAFQASGTPAKGLGEYQVIRGGQSAESGTIVFKRLKRRVDFPTDRDAFNPAVCPSDAEINK
jgi:S1-C subfamily serine protease